MRKLLLIALLALPASAQIRYVPNPFTGRMDAIYISSVLTNPSLGASSALTISVPNAASTGTTVKKLAKLTGAPSTAVIASTLDVSSIVGIVVSGAGTTGNAEITRAGEALCAFDGATTAGDYVQISATVAGDCHDFGATYPTSGQVIGFVLQTIGSAGDAMVMLRPDIQAYTFGLQLAMASSTQATVSAGGRLFGDASVTRAACTYTKASGTGSGLAYVWLTSTGTEAMNYPSAGSLSVTVAGDADCATQAVASPAWPEGLAFYPLGTVTFVSGSITAVTPANPLTAGWYTICGTNMACTYSNGAATIDVGADVMLLGGTNAMTGSLDLRNATAFWPVAGAADPGTCTEGQLFFNTTSHALKQCTGADTWGDMSAASATAMTQATANDTDNSVSVAVGTTGRAFEKTVVTIDPTTGAISTPGGITSGVGSGAAGFNAYGAGTAPSFGASAGQIPTAGYFGWMAPAAMTSTLMLAPPNADPAANQVMLFGAASGNKAAFTWLTVDAASSANTIVRRNASNEVIAANTVATGLTAMATNTALALSQLANQGTTATVLHGNAAGNPAFGAVVPADMSTAANTFSAVFNLPAPAAADDAIYTLLNPSSAIKLRQLSCGVTGTTSVVVNLVSSAASLIADATITAGTINQVTVTTWANGSSQCGSTSYCAVAAHTPVTLHVGTISGTPTNLACSIEYTKD